MPYDDGLAQRIRTILGDSSALEEREMFGGVGFVLAGNLVCGVHGDKLLARVGPDASEDALEEPHARPMDLTGRPMRGLVFVDPLGIATDEDLRDWVERCRTFAESLPPTSRVARPVSHRRPARSRSRT